MVYYTVGLAVSIIATVFFVSILETTASNIYDWVAIASLALLSAASAVVFLIGLVSQIVQNRRQTTPPLPIYGYKERGDTG